MVTGPRAQPSLRRQLILATVGVTAVGMVLLTVVLHLVLEDLSRGDVERVLSSRAADTVQAVQAASTAELTVEPSALDAGEAVYDETGRLVAGGPLRGLAEHYERLSTTSRPVEEGIGEDARLRAEPVQTPGGRGVVVVGVSLRAYETAEGYALALSIASSIIVVACAAFAAHRLTRWALRPVAEMASTAASWSEHDLGRRFDLGPPTTELTALGATLDGLLDQVATAIRAEQRLTAELAHELRTPLTTIQGLTDLTLMRDDLPQPARETLEQVAAFSRTMAATITTLLHVARSETAPAATTSLSDVVSAAVEAVTAADTAQTGPASRPRIEVSVEDHRLAVPHDLAVRALVPVIANAVTHAVSSVRIVDAEPAGGLVSILIEDDGPGVMTDEDIFEPGVSTGGTGLGLALARRVSRTAGGDVTLQSRSEPTRFSTTLPVAHTHG